MKRTLSLILALLIASATLTGCGSGTNDDTAEETADAAVTAEEEAVEEIAVEEETEYIDTLPEKDFGGKTYSFGVPEAYNMEPEEMTGETINDAVFTQITNVEERYNVDYTTLDVSQNAVAASVKAGDETYHMFTAGTSGGAATYVLTGYSKNLFLYDQIDFTRPWWNANTLEELSLNGKMYMAFGDICAERGITYTHSFYFNKVLAEKFDISSILEDNVGESNMYDTVRNGKWTIELLEKLIDGIYVDVDGDGNNNGKDFDDLYGLGQSIPVSGVYRTAFDCKIMARDADGVPYLNINTDKFNEIVPRIYSLCFENSAVLEVEHAEEDICGDTFVAGRLLLYSGFLCDVAKLRDMEDEFGVLPFPKYDEAQENYYTTVRGDNYFICSPVTVSEENMDFVGTVTEALAYYGYTLGRTAVYEDTLQGKMARDQDSIEMLDILVNGIVVEYAFAHAGSSDFSYVLWNLMSARSNSFASYYQKRLKPATKYYEKLLKQYSELDNAE